MPGKRRRLNSRPGDKMMGIVRKRRVQTDGAKALAMVRKLARQVEHKQVTKGSTLTTDSQVIHLNGVAEGTDGDERVGDRISGEKLKVRAAIEHRADNAGAVVPTQPLYVHIAVVQDLQQAADNVPTWSFIWTGTAQGGVYQNKLREAKYKVLRSKRVLINTISDAFAPSTLVDWNINLKGLDMRFNGANAGDQQGNGIYLTYKFESAETGAAPQTVWTSTLDYTDM